MRNPYYINFIWLVALIIIHGFVLLISCFCGYYCFSFSLRIEGILIGILSAAILLFLSEFIRFIIDRKKYGFLRGTYVRSMITEKNDGGLRSSEIPREERKQFEDNKGIRYIEDSIYHELLYYRCEGEKYLITLKYHFHGIYTGSVEYFDDNCNKGSWREREIRKIKALVTLNMNLANKMTGVGSYKYENKSDYGKYKFQINEENNDELIVYYKNTIPSGLAEGYEIWEKYKL